MLCRFFNLSAHAPTPLEGLEMNHDKLDGEVEHPASFAEVLGLTVSMPRGACILAALALVLALAFPSPANAATLLAADGVMGFVNNDVCGAAVQAGTAIGYSPPTTASAGQKAGYKKFTLAQLGKVNGLCVAGETKYKSGVVVYLPATFEVAVKVDKGGKPVADWQNDMHMWKCMNKIREIWTIDVKPTAVPAAKPAAPAASAPASAPCIVDCAPRVTKSETSKFCGIHVVNGAGYSLTLRLGYRGGWLVVSEVGKNTDTPSDSIKAKQGDMCDTLQTAVEQTHEWRGLARKFGIPDGCTRVRVGSGTV